MRYILRKLKFLYIGLDLLAFLVAFVFAFLLAPFTILQGAERSLLYARVLFPHGLITTGFRTMIDWRLGHMDKAISSLEGMIGFLEEAPKRKLGRKSYRLVISDLYSMMARGYLLRGHVDDAMLVIIRANNSIGVERLRGLSELDAKTANIVRAGLAAGRLIDGDGLATLFVRSSQDPNKVPRSKRSAKNRSKLSRKNRKGAVKDDKSKKTKQNKVNAKNIDRKIIPFPAVPGKPLN